MNQHVKIPEFNFVVPIGYHWLLERRLVNFAPFSPLEPWYYLEDREYFEVSQKWPHVSNHERLVAFARRQDCDDIGCFIVDGARANGIVVIQGWTGSGYEIISRHSSFWEWLKSVVDDIAEWVDAQ